MLGRDVDPVLSRFLTGMPSRFSVATESVEMEGVHLRIHPGTGKVKRIKRIRERPDSG